MKTYEITVRQYMTRKSDENFDFMSKWNNDIPMPLVTMTGTIEKETKGMIYMKLHGDIHATTVKRCMKCGKMITNQISQYFGMGPECGQHKYINPFKTQEELKTAVDKYKKEFLQKITWEGWIIKSAIVDQTLIFDDGMDVKPQAKIELGDAKELFGLSMFSAYVKFEYNDSVLNSIRALPFKHWDNEAKVWEIPSDSFKNIKSVLENNGFEVEVIDTRVEKPNKKEHIDFEFKTKPFQHQIEGFEYGLDHNRWLLGDEQGLGKTKQVIDIACAKKVQMGLKHCLIICGVNGLKWNWLNEIEIHSNEHGRILGQKTLKNGKVKIGSSKDKLNDLLNIDNLDEFFLITNLESLRDKDIANELNKLCKDNTIGMVAIDEMHKAKNHTSQQGKGLLKIQPQIRIAMTGTPLMNQPLDLYMILKWLGYENHAFYSFRNHYCYMGGFSGYEVIGYHNLDELRTRLDAIMLRRLKEDVLDLPDKLFIDEYVEMTPKQNVIYKEVTSDIAMHIDEIAESNNPLAQLIRLRQATGYTGILSSEIQESAKMDRMEELVEESVENNKKVVIFSNWTSMTNPIYQRLQKYNPRIITGETKDEDRQQYVEDFQNDDSCKVIIGTIGAMGTGLTLTSGTVEIFMDEPWNMANKQQAIDRCHRIGAKSNVTIYTLLCKGTIDERIHDLVQKKGEISDLIIDGKITGNKKELLNYLLS